MEINFLLLIVVIILATGTIWGWKRGLLESVIRIVSGVLGMLVIAIVAKGVGNFLQKSYVNVLLALILLLAIRIIHKIVRFLLDTFKLVRALPIGNLTDKLAGAVLGLVEAVFTVWFLFLLLKMFDVLHLNTWVMEQVSESSLLTILYDINYLVVLLRKI